MFWEVDPEERIIPDSYIGTLNKNETEKKKGYILKLYC